MKNRDFRKLSVHRHWEADCTVTELFDNNDIKYRRFVATILNNKGIVVHEGAVNAIVIVKIIMILRMVKALIKNDEVRNMIKSNKRIDFFRLQDIYYRELNRRQYEIET